VGTTIDETMTTDKTEEIDQTEDPGECLEDTENHEDTEDTEEERAGGYALEQPYQVPSDSAFRGKVYIVEPPDLVQIMKDLIFECAPLFNHLQGASIEINWKRKGGMANGGVQDSGHFRTTAHAAAHDAKDFCLWVAADLARESCTKTDIEERVYHELCHLGFNENTQEIKIVDEPVKYFPTEKRRYNLPDPLDGEGGDEEDTPLLRELEGIEEGDEELPILAQHLDEHPEQIEPVLAAAGDADTPVAETAKRARGRRAASTTAGGAVGIAG
jgi:hypothetical protein